MTEPLTEYARHNTCRHGVVASRCTECKAETDHNKPHYITLPLEVTKDPRIDVNSNDSAEPGYRVVRIKDTVVEIVKCRHNEIPGECGQCLYEQKEAMSNKVNMPGILHQTEQAYACFHGVVGKCDQCIHMFELKQAAITQPAYSRQNDVKQHILGLLKIIINMLEEL